MTWLTNFMEQSPSWKANSSSASQEIARILWNPKVHQLINSFTTARHLSLSYARSIQSMPSSHFSEIHFNIILPLTPWSSKWSPSLRFPHQNHVCASPRLHTCNTPCPSVFLIWSPKWYLVGSAEHKAPRYVVFSTLLLPRPSQIQISS